VSDPLNLDVAPLVDLAVSVYLPGQVPESFQLTGHDPAHQTNYISPGGDFAAATDMPVQEQTEVFLFVTGIEVLAPRQAGGIVAFGDSLTEGNISRLDANNRWPDQLARRLVARPGVTHVVVLLGVNDLRNSQGRADEIVTADDLIGGLHQLAVRAHAAGLAAFVGTVMTWENETFNGGHYTPEGEAKRRALNAWIRDNGVFDGVIDFEAALRDPGHPTRTLPRWDSGDHLHPNDLGYRHMADDIDLALFG